MQIFTVLLFSGFAFASDNPLTSTSFDLFNQESAPSSRVPSPVHFNSMPPSRAPSPFRFDSFPPSPTSSPLRTSISMLPFTPFRPLSSSEPTIGNLVSAETAPNDDHFSYDVNFWDNYRVEDLVNSSPPATNIPTVSSFPVPQAQTGPASAPNPRKRRQDDSQNQPPAKKLQSTLRNVQQVEKKQRKTAARDPSKIRFRDMTSIYAKSKPDHPVWGESSNPQTNQANHDRSGAQADQPISYQSEFLLPGSQGKLRKKPNRVIPRRPDQSSDSTTSTFTRTSQDSAIVQDNSSSRSIQDHQSDCVECMSCPECSYCPQCANCPECTATFPQPASVLPVTLHQRSVLPVTLHQRSVLPVPLPRTQVQPNSQARATSSPRDLEFPMGLLQHNINHTQNSPSE